MQYDPWVYPCLYGFGEVLVYKSRPQLGSIRTCWQSDPGRPRSSSFSRFFIPPLFRITNISNVLPVSMYSMNPLFNITSRHSIYILLASPLKGFACAVVYDALRKQSYRTPTSLSAHVLCCRTKCDAFGGPSAQKTPTLTDQITCLPKLLLASTHSSLNTTHNTGVF